MEDRFTTYKRHLGSIKTSYKKVDIHFHLNIYIMILLILKITFKSPIICLFPL